MTRRSPAGRVPHRRRQPYGGSGGNAAARLELARPQRIYCFSYLVHHFSFAADQAFSLSSAHAIANRSGPAATQFHLYAAGRAWVAADATGAAQPANAHRSAHIAPDGPAGCSATAAWAEGAGARGARYAHGAGARASRSA